MPIERCNTRACWPPPNKKAARQNDGGLEDPALGSAGGSKSSAIPGEIQAQMLHLSAQGVPISLIERVARWRLAHPRAELPAPLQREVGRAWLRALAA